MDPRRTTAGQDTIAAIASPPGPAARGVIRVSGPRASELVRATWSGAILPDLSERVLARGAFDDGRGTQPLLLLWMKGPRSFTREDVAEFHLPGHPGLLDAALLRLVELGARRAEPGEFTRRAFHSGRIDLTRAEGVLALVFAANEAEARAARALLYGGLEGRVAAARAALVDVRTLVEASLDFDENDTGHVPAREIEALAEKAAREIELARGFEQSRAPGSGLPRVVLCGAPNAGKSSLFNVLAGEDALVSRHAGTTRDVLEARVLVPGGSAILIDTAGIESAGGGPSAAAQQAAERARAEADVWLWVVDGTGADIVQEPVASSGRPTILVWHKADLAGPPLEWAAQVGAVERVAVSSVTGQGIDALRGVIGQVLGRLTGGRGREIFQRHERALGEAGAELLRARAGLRGSEALELVAEHLRRATDALDQVSGGTTPEDVLDRIFAAFCLGK
jgi:tRNA modification GTPase